MKKTSSFANDSTEMALVIIATVIMALATFFIH